MSDRALESQLRDKLLTLPDSHQHSDAKELNMSASEAPAVSPATTESPTANDAKLTPEKLQVKWWGLGPAVFIGTLLLAYILFLMAQSGGNVSLAAILVGITVGLTMTAAGMSWAATIALAESPVKGTLFVLCPPYTFWHAAVRYDIFWQSMLVFFLGLLLCAEAVLFAYLAILPAAL